ncbi:carbohydrate-binding module family 48 protein [Hydnum rufescens UP504]|uniref:Carbohydrate-binding module family 48 protein n=1 Tax=Hydnum rufescens UP504 TaxID=1448309 RepID=A0A9P6B3X7_9AGAM|nr:carbohydrate-binding module family 48 protein [Hydnum rufescens UP504]
MGQQNSSTTSPRPPAQDQKKRPQPPRRTSLELPDIHKMSISHLNPRRPPAPSTAPAPIPIPPSNIHAMIDVGNHLGSSPMSPFHHPPTPPHRSRYSPHGSPVPDTSRRQDDSQPRRSDPAAPTPETHIHSSIPLGITLPVAGNSPPPEAGDGLVPTNIIWRAGGNNVLLAGTFDSSWRGRVRLNPEPGVPNTFSVTIRLPPGNHRLKFIVDDQWRCSDDYPTATDNDGHLVNYIEVPNVSGSSSGWDPSSEPSSPQLSRQQTPFGGDIPPHLAHSALLEEQYLSQRMPNPPPIPHPAALPRHLEKVILNAQRHGRDRAVMEGVRDDNSVLPIPNHVVLNHLGTSAIKNGVLAVATTMRYHKKYISTLYFKPVST